METGLRQYDVVIHIFLFASIGGKNSKNVGRALPDSILQLYGKLTGNP
jgi:hypothetical protein